MLIKGDDVIKCRYFGCFAGKISQYTSRVKCRLIPEQHSFENDNQRQQGYNENEKKLL